MADPAGGYWEAYADMMRQGLPMMTMQQRMRQEQFMNQMRMAQLQRQQQQMMLQERYRTEMLRNQGFNQQRLMQDLAEKMRHNSQTERLGRENLNARRQAQQQPHFGPAMEMQDAEGNPVTVFADAKSGRLFDPVKQRWLGTMNSDGSVGDPAFAASVLRKPQALPVTARRDLATHASEIQALVGLAKSFKPSYAGSILPIAGDIENVIRQYTPGVNSDMPNWWREYKRLSQIPERHTQFGGALTKSEEASWKAAEINPGMKPEDVRRNMNIRVGLMRLANERAMLGLGPRFNRREIEEASGTTMPKSRKNFLPTQDSIMGLGSELTGMGGVPPLEELIK